MSAPRLASGKLETQDNKPLVLSGPFANASMAMSAAGLVVIPVGGDDGKKPLLRWRNRRRPYGAEAAAKMSAQFPDANIGILTGPSGVTVVDCDAPEAIAAMVERCGDTPLKTSTPSGGVHLWYRSAGEHCADLRSEGLAVDVKGIGGFVVVPPSIRPSGPYKGGSYAFLEGSWDDLARLPVIQPSALAKLKARAPAHPTPLGAVRDGRRNNTLYRNLLRIAPDCTTVQELTEAAFALNADFDPPMPRPEVEKTAASAWRCQVEGRNWVGSRGRIVTKAEDYRALAGCTHGADAFFLLASLKLAHGSRAQFAVSPKAMHDAQVIPRWGRQRYRNALNTLVEAGLLIRLHKGGSAKGDYTVFRLSAAPNLFSPTGEEKEEGCLIILGPESGLAVA